MEASPDTPEVEEEDIVWAHVVDQLQQLGFNSHQAMSLADAGVDWHDARRLINKGCPIETAIDLLL